MNLTRRGFFSFLTGSAAALAAGAALPEGAALPPVVTTPVPPGFNPAGMGDWIELPQVGAMRDLNLHGSETERF